MQDRGDGPDRIVWIPGEGECRLCDLDAEGLRTYARWSQAGVGEKLAMRLTDYLRTEAQHAVEEIGGDAAGDEGWSLELSRLVGRPVTASDLERWRSDAWAMPAPVLLALINAGGSIP